MNDNKKIRIKLFAPSGNYSQEIMDSGLDIVKKEFPPYTQIVDVLKNTHTEAPFPYLRDSDKNQIENFLSTFKDCDFLWCVRGGYGSSRWADRIMWQDIVKKGMPVIIGFSDITFLHCGIVRYGGVSIHGPMLCTLKDTDLDVIQMLIRCIYKDVFTELPGKVICKGLTTGKLVGGNLACLCSVPGTALEPEWNDKILFLEECNEALYRIDRMLTWLLASGLLKKVSGIALGTFTNTGSHEKMVEKLFHDRLSHLGIPVLHNLPAGHTAKNRPLLMGGKYILDAEERSALIPDVS